MLEVFGTMPARIGGKDRFLRFRRIGALLYRRHGQLRGAEPGFHVGAGA